MGKKKAKLRRLPEAEMLPAFRLLTRPTRAEVESPEDPGIYGYHELSALALGKGFDHRDVVKSKIPCLEFSDSKIDPGIPGTGADLLYVTSSDQLSKATSLDTKVEASYLVG